MSASILKKCFDFSFIPFFVAVFFEACKVYQPAPNGQKDYWKFFKLCDLADIKFEISFFSKIHYL